MRIPDYFSGLIVLSLAAIAFFMASNFPPGIARSLGPGVFPMVITAVLMACSVILIVKSFLERRAQGDKDPGLQASRMSLTTWGLFLVVCAMPVIYVLMIKNVGFLLTGCIILFIPTMIFWGGPVRSAIFTLACVVALDGVFRGGFGLPLDRGLFYIPLW